MKRYLLTAALLLALGSVLSSKDQAPPAPTSDTVLAALVDIAAGQREVITDLDRRLTQAEERLDDVSARTAMLEIEQEKR